MARAHDAGDAGKSGRRKDAHARDGVAAHHRRAWSLQTVVMISSVLMPCSELLMVPRLTWPSWLWIAFSGPLLRTFEVAPPRIWRAD